MPVPQEIVKLVARFDAQCEAYQSGKYNEAQIRAEFIDPLFKALGWDIHNEQGYAEAYKDVIHEDAIKIGGATEAPDLCFRIGGTRKFFVECKKPSVNIKDDVHPAYQLRRYAWSARLPLSILTDFHELAVYDCRAKPNKNDTAAIGRLMYFTSNQFAEKWDEFAAIFARESVLKGSFDKFAEGAKGRKGTASVDDAFLEEIERWRDMLAHNIAIRNEKLSQRELNFSVQRIIDRIIFLRICEDRGIEPYGRLMTLKNGERAYPRLGEFFQRADERYNSGIFRFTVDAASSRVGEKKRQDAASTSAEPPDELTLTLAIDDKVIKDIVGNLYYPESPYEFSVLPADILGHVYERFLGKVIRLTAGHQAKVEDKPEVRKAGGVYYTPTYIVDYIVKNTVGKLLEDIISHKDTKSPRNAILQAAKLKILDPACGSGSFLLGAYQYLLNWHRDCYVKVGSDRGADRGQKVAADLRAAVADRTRSARPTLPIFQSAGGDYRLTTDEKKRILLNNIYGVDIDSQAVEVTKLSLLLKVLEGESQETITKQFELFHQRALPDLGSNIKCGNSLIGPDFYKDRQGELFGEDEMCRINAFDWQAEFPQVFGEEGHGLRSLGVGGFGAVIGNPPYIRIQTMKEWAPVEVELYKTLYRSAADGNYDIYVVFVEKALSLLNKTGRTGFILPHKFFNAQYGEALRGLIAGGKHLAHVVHFGDQQVFAGATTYTCLMFLDKAGASECQIVKVSDLDAWKVDAASSRVQEKRQDAASTGVTEGHILAKTITAAEWNFSVGRGAEALRRVHEMKIKLGDVADIFVGLQTSADRIYVVPLDSPIEKGLTKPFLLTGDLSAYTMATPSARLVFPYEIKDGKVDLIPSDMLKQRFPKGWAYLSEHRAKLMARDNGKMNRERWYAYVYPKNLVKFDEPKLIVQVTARCPTVMFDDTGLYMTGGGSGPFYGIRPKDQAFPIKYLLGIMNSALFGWIVKAQSTNLRGGYIKFSKQYIETVPIISLEQAGPAAVNALVAQVDEIIRLHKQRRAAKTPDEKTRIERQISATDREIDRLVYELYGLTASEIAIVERAVK